MPVFKKNSRLVGRLESGVSASASSEIFAKTAGAGNVLGREGNCPGGGHVRAEYLRGGGMPREKCPTFLPRRLTDRAYYQCDDGEIC